MLLRSTTKPLILGVLTKTYISEAFCINFVNTSMLLRLKTKPPIFSIRGRFDQTSFFMRGVNRASVLIDSNKQFPHQFSLLGGLIMRGVDRTKNRHL